MMTNEKYCIIMAGGVGSRFWPLSKDDCPKQFIDVLGTGKSFIRTTFERFRHSIPAEHFLVVTNVRYKELVLRHLPELKPEQVLCEPMRRNTAPCIAYANYRILSQCPQASIVVSPADHLITNGVEFDRILNIGFDFVERPQHQEALLTIGIQPSRPETGYGYIQVQPATPQDGGEVRQVVSFKEKPDLSTAQRYVQTGITIGTQAYSSGRCKAYSRPTAPICPTWRRSLTRAATSSAHPRSRTSSTGCSHNVRTLA